MYHFTVEDFQAAESCIKCCCERLNLKPGTTSKVSVGYAPWAVPIGQLHCVPQFSIEQMDTCPVATTGDLPPRQADVTPFETLQNAHLDGDLKTKIVDPEAVALSFKLLPLYGPKHGKLALSSDGLFDYDPDPNYSGQDRFYVNASDGAHSVIFEIMIAVGIDPDTMTLTPHVSVGAPSIDQRFFTASFPITISPAAQACEVWRLTVLQAALDCDCTCFTRSDCFDVHIAKC